MNNSKRIISLLLSLVMIMSVFTIVPFSVSAADTEAAATAETDGDYEYRILDDGTAEITGYSGEGGDVTIPSTLDEYTVTIIGNYAFEDCTGLTSIDIPDSVTSIGQYAFLNCTDLEHIKVSKDNAVYDSRENCNAIILTEYNRLEIGCNNTVIPDSVTSIGGFAFIRRTGLTNITIPVSVTSIGNNAFAGCSSLTSIDIPDSVTWIGISAFSGCTGLTSIDIPDSVTDIGHQAFYGCTGLESIKVSENNSVYDSRENCNAIIFTKYNRLILGCKNTIIPDSIIIINSYAFSDCTGLISIDIPDSVTSIDYGAFLGCTGLTSVTIPDSVTSIGDKAFGYYDWSNKGDGFTIYGYAGTAAETYANDNGFTFITLDAILELHDDSTDISVKVTDDVSLSVTDVTVGEAIGSIQLAKDEKLEKAFDIKLLSDGVVTQPSGAVTVKIPCDNENAKVYRVEDDSSLMDMNAKYKDGYMVFTTDHFSVYVLAEPNVKTGVTVSGTITSYIDDSDVTVKLTGADNNFTAEVKGKSDYSIEAVPAGEYTLTVSKANHVTREYTVTVDNEEVTQDVKLNPKGDVNGDGETDIMDCSVAQRYIRELTTLDDYQIACGDVSGTGDGELDIQDVSRILRHIRELAMLY